MSSSPALPRASTPARLLAGIIAVALLLLAFAGRAEAGAWGAPVDISAAGQSGERVQLGADAQGNQIAVWEGFASGPERLVMAAIRPARGTWGTPIELSAPGGAFSEPNEPSVAVNARGEAVVAWSRLVGSEYQVEVARGDTSGNWSAPEVISPSGVRSTLARAGIDATGNAFVSWVEELEPGLRGTAVRVQEGGAWGAPEVFAPVAGEDEAPNVSVNPNGWAVLLRHQEGEIEATSRPPGGSWIPLSPLASGASYRWFQVAIADNAEAVAIWRNQSTDKIEAARMSVGGTWGAPEVLPTTQTNITQPSVAIDSTGQAVAVWVSQQGSPTWTIEAATQAPGSPWAAAPALIVPEESYSPQIKLRSNGTVIMVMNPWQGSSYGLTGAERAADGTWGPEFELGEPGEEIYAPALSTDAAGGVTVAWENEGASVNPIRSVAILPPEPTPPAPPTPTPTPGGDTTPSSPSNSNPAGSSGPGTPATQNACTAAPGAVAANGYVPPVTKPGKTVPGVRARITVGTPSNVQVAATFEYKDGGKLRTVDGGTYSMSVGAKRNLRIAIPSSLRTQMPLGATARVALRIAATPADAGPCTTSTTTKTAKLKLKVVKVLTDRLS